MRQDGERRVNIGTKKETALQKKKKYIVNNNVC